MKISPVDLVATIPSGRLEIRIIVTPLSEHDYDAREYAEDALTIEAKLIAFAKAWGRSGEKALGAALDASQ